MSEDISPSNIILPDYNSNPVCRRKRRRRRSYQKPSAAIKEKERLKTFNQALQKLQSVIPVKLPEGRRLHKKQTLQLACRYIQFLRDCLDGKREYKDRSRFWCESDEDYSVIDAIDAAANAVSAYVPKRKHNGARKLARSNQPPARNSLTASNNTGVQNYEGFVPPSANYNFTWATPPQQVMTKYFLSNGSYQISNFIPTQETPQNSYPNMGCLTYNVELTPTTSFQSINQESFKSYPIELDHFAQVTKENEKEALRSSNCDHLKEDHQTIEEQLEEAWRNLSDIIF